MGLVFKLVSLTRGQCLAWGGTKVKVMSGCGALFVKGTGLGGCVGRSFRRKVLQEGGFVFEIGFPSLRTS